MANELEKRIASRHSIEGPISLHTTILKSKEINARLLNFSEQGICFTTNKELVPGTTIMFKASNECHYSAESYEGCQLRSISMVTVKWCHESSQEDQHFYVVGANYMMPI